MIWSHLLIYIFTVSPIPFLFSTCRFVFFPSPLLLLPLIRYNLSQLFTTSYMLLLHLYGFCWFSLTFIFAVRDCCCFALSLGMLKKKDLMKQCCSLLMFCPGFWHGRTASLVDRNVRRGKSSSMIIIFVFSLMKYSINVLLKLLLFCLFRRDTLATKHYSIF